MDIIVQQGDLAQVSCDVLVVNLFEGVTQPGGATGAVDSALGGWISDLIAQQNFKGNANNILELPTFGKIPAKWVIVVGLGDRNKFGLEQVRQAAAAAVKRARSLKAQTVATLLHGAGIAGLPANDCAQAITEGTLLGGYEFSKYKTPAKDEPKVEIEQVIIVEQDAEKIDAAQAGIKTGTIIANATCMARDLATEPPDLVTPEYMAQIARKLGSEYGLTCEIWDEKRLQSERMNCLAMVGRGSANPPRFIRLEYAPKGDVQKRICIIGKGLCYDSGGLSLKPPTSMHHMKTDMSGAADVLAIMQAIAQLKPNVAVTGLIPACENMIGDAAYKVDDILRARNGKTIEVDNTDAEGRLVLADALSYAAEQHYDEVIDFATLTGGCIVALARVWTGVMGNDQALIDRIIATGNAVGEKMWMLPFDDAIRQMLDSDVADIKNSGIREGSAIQGGIFLEEFAGDQPWAHLDIAGTSYIDKDRGYEVKGATGIPVRTMIAYLTQQ
ncbi:MAG TPA: leucyl aminopeptidase [Armatimonadota bacterium]|nr:leucyl aminopeptidase [Armatimonadota bacterium]